MPTIKIDVDMEKKTITKYDIAPELQKDPIVLALVFNQLSRMALSSIKLEPVSNIIKPKLKMVKP